MATHDYVIDNGTGSAVRADLNLLFKAILTNNSGTTDPSTVISSDAGSKAFSFWADTNSSPAVLKIRNAADDGWIELFQLDGTLTLEDGSASTPGLAFRDDLNTGIFSSAADTFNVATAGVERMELGATTIFNEDGADVDFRIEGDTQANLFYVDAGNDRVGIGRSDPQTTFHSTGTTNGQQATFGASSTGLKISTFAKTDNDAGVILDAQQSSNGTLTFATTGSERVRIDSSGNVGIGTSSPAALLHVQKSGTSENLLTLESDLGSNNNRTLIIGGPTSDSATAPFRFTTGNSLSFVIDSTSALDIDASGNVGIGTASPSDLLDVTESSASAAAASSASVAQFERAGNVGITISTADTGDATIFFGDTASSTVGRVNYDHNDNSLGFFANSNERMRVDSTGRLLIGSTSHVSNGGIEAHLQVIGTGTDDSSITMSRFSNDVHSAYLVFSKSRNTSIGGNTIVQPDDSLGRMTFFGNDGTDNNTPAAEIDIEVDGTPGSNDMPGRIIFRTNAGGTATAERMRIDKSGNVLIGCTTLEAGFGGVVVKPNNDDGSATVVFDRSNTSASSFAFSFENNDVSSGTISYNNTSTTYATSSDYRLKENAVAISDGITRLKTLKPYRFNFKVDATKTVDGFFAHEVTAVPEAVTGTKDEVDSDNKPVYQGIDQSKLVPLLVAAVQELITKVETLEAA